MGLKALEGPITVKLNNVSAMECNIIRHFFQGALNHFYKLAQVSLRLVCAHARCLGCNVLLYADSSVVLVWYDTKYIAETPLLLAATDGGTS